MGKKIAIAESKSVVEPKAFNGEILPSTKRTGIYDQIASGICPHDGATLGDSMKTENVVGETRICSKCGHRWYINYKIHTTGCRTCGSLRRRSLKSKKPRANVIDVARASDYNKASKTSPKVATTAGMAESQAFGDDVRPVAILQNACRRFSVKKEAHPFGKESPSFTVGSIFFFHHLLVVLP